MVEQTNFFGMTNTYFDRYGVNSPRCTTVELTAPAVGKRFVSFAAGETRFTHSAVSQTGDGAQACGVLDGDGLKGERRRVVATEAQTAQARRNEASKAIGAAKARRDDPTDLMAEVAALKLRGRVADLVADVGPRVRVGVVETQRILLHDVDGVAVFCRHTLPLTSRGLVDQAELADLADDVLGTAPEVLADLADAVALGLLPGESTPLQVDTEPLPESPAYALDADEAGVTLLRVRDGESTAVHVALPGAGRLDHSPRHAWRRLLDAIPARVAHP